MRYRGSRRKSRAFTGCIGREFAGMIFPDAATWSFDTVVEACNTCQRTPSEHGGVVGELALRLESLMMP